MVLSISPPPLHSDGSNPQWGGGEQFSVVTTVHAGAANPAEMGGSPGQYLSQVNNPHANNVSYTTSPHALGSAQWAPPNANLFPQNSGIPNHVGVPPNAAFPEQQPVGPRFKGVVGGEQRSQGSNLSAAAAAAAAVMAAATATAHATATLTLKPGMQSFPPDVHHSQQQQMQQQMQQQQQQAQSVVHQTAPHLVRVRETCESEPVLEDGYMYVVGKLS